MTLTAEPQVLDESALPSTDQAPEETPEETPEPRHPWYSGWCGAGPVCLDGTTVEGGVVIRRCRYVGVNGEKAPIPVMYCACSCHRDPERAGQAIARD